MPYLMLSFLTQQTLLNDNIYHAVDLLLCHWIRFWVVSSSNHRKNHLVVDLKKIEQVNARCSVLICSVFVDVQTS